MTSYRAIIAGGGTGGHLYPALSLAEALQQRAHSKLEILFIGAQRGIESRILPKKGIPHRLLPLEPIDRGRPWRNWRLLPSAIRSSYAIRQVLRTFAPQLVVGTGGYAAGPVVAWAIARRLRTAIQEQNSYPGLTTRWLARWVDQLHLGYPEALKHLRPGRHTTVQVHGNPIRWPRSEPDPVAVRRELGLVGERIVLVVGGSQGSASINAAVLAALGAVQRGELPALPDGVQMLWSTGPTHFSEIARQLESVDRHGAVRAVPYIDEMEKALSVATLAVSRAGALALTEFCAWGIPLVLIPYPYAANDHQTWNARALEEAGAAVLISDEVVSADSQMLWRPMLDVLADGARRAKMSQAALARGNRGAADQIASDLLQLLEAR